MIKSKLEQNTNRVISGYVSTKDLSKRYIEIYFEDTFLRRVPAHLNRKFNVIDSDILGFWFAIHPSLVKLIPENTILKVKDADGRPLPIAKTALISPIGSATDEGAALLELLAKGHLVDKWGALKIPFSAESEKRERYAEEMRRTIDFFDRRGLVAFPHYGTLLGLVREGKFIDHDDDVDLSIAIYDSSLIKIVDKYYDIVESLIDEGHRVDLIETGQIHFREKGSTGPLLDIFLTWGTNEFEFNTYFGVVGNLSSPLSFKDAELEGQKVKIPTLAEEVVELTFGPNWKTPDSSFVWQGQAHLTEVMTKIKKIGRPRLDSIIERLKVAN